MTSREIAYIYVMGIEGGPSKIGKSLVPARRLKEVQAEHKGEITVLGTWPVGARIALAAERYVHWLLREKHFRGEWFNVTREEAIEAVRVALAAEASLDPHNLIPPLEARGRKRREPLP